MTLENPLNIRRKSCFAVLAVLEIHLALHVPKSESLQLFDSQPQRLRPSDSVRLAEGVTHHLSLRFGGVRFANPPYGLSKNFRSHVGLTKPRSSSGHGSAIR